MSLEKEIFKAGSTTYYWSSKFFPKNVRDDVFKLYSFVRVVDDYVDEVESDVESFNHMKTRWNEAKKDLSHFNSQNDSVAERVLQNIVYIVHRFRCDPAWVDSFLESMQMDIDNRTYESIDDTLEYIYGSAEVIGLFMARILNLPEEALESARMQGRAMQFINFIRDIEEDNQLGRQYFPKKELKKYGLKSLSKKEAESKKNSFEEFVQAQFSLYQKWQSEADKGFMYIPKRLRIPLRTAVDAYNWTGEKIVKNPSIVYEKQLKPSKKRMIKTGITRTIVS